jgi:hypothetical protein
VLQIGKVSFFLSYFSFFNFPFEDWHDGRTLQKDKRRLTNDMISAFKLVNFLFTVSLSLSCFVKFFKRDVRMSYPFHKKKLQVFDKITYSKYFHSKVFFTFFYIELFMETNDFLLPVSLLKKKIASSDGITEILKKLIISSQIFILLPDLL